MRGTIIGIHHAAINVVDMKRSIKFYTEIMNLKLVVSPRTYSGRELDHVINVKNARVKGALLMAEDGSILELLQYLSPVGRPYDRRNCDLGNMHLAFRVKDISKIYDRLTNSEVRFNTRPSTVKLGPLKGVKFVYFIDPNGVTLELFEEPTKITNSLLHSRNKGKSL